MKEILCIVDKPYSYCEELKEHILSSTDYKELGFMPPTKGDTFKDLFKNKDGDHFVCVAKPHVARELKLYFDKSKSIAIKLILICSEESVTLKRARNNTKNTLCVTAIERLSIEGLNKLLNDVEVDVLFDGRGSLKSLKKQFDNYIKKGITTDVEISNKKDNTAVTEYQGNVVFKCTLVESRVKRAHELGCDKFEIHTDDRFLCDPDSVRNAIKLLDMYDDIVTIHTPLDSSFAVLEESSCTVGGTVYYSETRRAVKRCMKLAQACADKFGHRVGVVIHNTEPVRTLFINGDNTKLVNVYTRLLNKYPDVDIYIENTSPIEIDITGGYKFHDGFFEDVPTIVQLLNTHICKDGVKRFYSCLDTCHLLGAVRVCKAIGTPSKYSIPEYFRLYGDTCAQIHLAYCKNFGNKKGEHGTGFQHNLSTLKEWLNLISTFMPSANIVLEMYEDDYDNPVNCLHAADYINKHRES